MKDNPKSLKMIAACGLDCEKCDIYKASDDPELAQKFVDWFKRERNEDVAISQIRCAGCRGERAEHWSPDCWILKCCVDEKGHDFCFQCDEFPCEKLTAWADTEDGYQEALQRLKTLQKM